MNSYKSSAELKGMAKEQLFGQYATAIGASLLLGIITLVINFIPQFLIGIDSLPQLVIYYLTSFVLSLFGGILASGRVFLYLKLACGQPVSVGDIFYGFRVCPDKALLIQLALSAASYLCQAPMLVFRSLCTANPGNALYLLLMSLSAVAGTTVLAVISLMLSQSFYLLQDFPQYSAAELLKMSCRIMKGHKGRLFYISISFLPLYFLGFFSCCIAFLWIIPYMNMVMADFYMDLMKNRN